MNNFGKGFWNGILIVIPFWVFVAWLFCGCASNLCMIDASIQQQRLLDAGIPARVAAVNAGGYQHAVVLWRCADGRQYVYDGNNSLRYDGNEHDACALVGVANNVPCRFVGWEEVAK